MTSQWCSLRTRGARLRAAQFSLGHRAEKEKERAWARFQLVSLQCGPGAQLGTVLDDDWGSTRK
jgi:hypothetical protein